MKLLQVDGGFEFVCPGCGERHVLDSRWVFNYDMDRPTFSPSVLAKWANGMRCHSVVTAGRIRFLNDSTHALRGQSVPLPEQT